MLRKVTCNLIYVHETRDSNNYPIQTENKKEVLADFIGTWSSVYYQTRQRDMQKAINLSVARDYVTDELQFVEYRNQRYVVKDVLIDNNRGDFFAILDLEEFK